MNKKYNLFNSKIKKGIVVMSITCLFLGGTTAVFNNMSASKGITLNSQTINKKDISLFDLKSLKLKDLNNISQNAVVKEKIAKMNGYNKNEVTINDTYINTKYSDTSMKAKHLVKYGVSYKGIDLFCKAGEYDGKIHTKKELETIIPKVAKLNGEITIGKVTTQTHTDYKGQLITTYDIKVDSLSDELLKNYKVMYHIKKKEK